LFRVVCAGSLKYCNYYSFYQRMFAVIHCRSLKAVIFARTKARTAGSLVGEEINQQVNGARRRRPDRARAARRRRKPLFQDSRSLARLGFLFSLEKPND
jgi:hypothetical protein